MHLISVKLSLIDEQQLIISKLVVWSIQSLVY